MPVERLLTLIGTAVGVPIAIIVALTPLITFLVKRADERRDNTKDAGTDQAVVQGQAIDFFEAKTIQLLEDRIAELKAENAALKNPLTTDQEVS